MVSDTDGSAFITKAEFDSLKNNFQAQIDGYNSSIDNNIDRAIASYLSGIKISTELLAENYIYKINNKTSTSADNPWKITFSKGWTVPTTQIGDFMRFGTGYALVYGRKYDNGTKTSMGYNAVVRGTGGATEIREKTKGTTKTRMAQVTKDNNSGRYYFQHNLFYECEPTAFLSLTGWHSGEYTAFPVWPTSDISNWTCTFEEPTFTNNANSFRTQFGVECDGTFALGTTYVGNSYTLQGIYNTSINDTILSLSSVGNGKYVNIFAGGVVVSGSIYGNTADRWQKTTPDNDDNLKIHNDGLNKWQGAVYDNSTTIRSTVGKFESFGADKIIGGATYYGYNREYNTYNASDLLFYEPYSITSKEVTYYSGCPICTPMDNGVATIHLKFSAPSNTNFSFGIREEAYTNIAGLDTTGIVPLFKDKGLSTPQSTSFTSTSMQDLIFYMNVESGKTYWLKVIPSETSKNITVESPDENIKITKEQ